jgi:hypothetical protein
MFFSSIWLIHRGVRWRDRTTFGDSDREDQGATQTQSQVEPQGSNLFLFNRNPAAAAESPLEIALVTLCSFSLLPLAPYWAWHWKCSGSPRKL